MRTSLGRPRGTTLAAALIAVCGLAACSSSPSSGGTTTSSPPAHGAADVAYADSLEVVFNSALQPGFQQESGDTVTGRANGSTTLAEDILSGEITPGVFISVGKKAIESLFTKKADFYLQLATDPLVVAYNPKSSHAAQFAAIAHGTKPLSDLFTLLATPGLRLGRTDPNADPQGVYFLLMCELAQHVLGLSSDPASTVLGVSASQPFGKTSQIVDSDSLISDLQSGEFDATSGYLTQAVQSKLPYITLPASLDFADPADDASYGTVSVTLTNGTVDRGGLITLDVTLVTPPPGAAAPSAADVTADDAFVSYLLSPAGRSVLQQGGYTVAPPVFTPATASATAGATLPAGVLSAFNGAGGTTAAG